MKKVLTIGLILVMFVYGLSRLFEMLNEQNSQVNKSENLEFANENNLKERVVTPTIVVKPTKVVSRSIEHVVPFTSQAPTGNWANTFFQDGCEEASVLMVLCASKDINCEIQENRIQGSFANKMLVDMGEWQTSLFGNGVDTSTEDTLKRLVRDFYKSKSGQVLGVSKIEDLIDGLEEGKIYIVPTDGRLLFNPNFTNGGPERHNLVVLGFDRDEEVFITNDPGTRNGKGYKYKFEILWRAMGDYPTGDHEKITERPKKVIEFDLETI